jgi:hypothetical protein
MAVKTVAVTALTSGTAVALPETTALNGSTDTLSITGASDADKLLILINNTTAAEKEVTIKKGENPPAVRKGLGDLVIKVPEKSQAVVAIESARFANTEGNIIVSCAASTTGFLSAIRLPKAP